MGRDVPADRGLAGTLERATLIEGGVDGGEMSGSSGTWRFEGFLPQRTSKDGLECVSLFTRGAVAAVAKLSCRRSADRSAECDALGVELPVLASSASRLGAVVRRWRPWDPEVFLVRGSAVSLPVCASCARGCSSQISTEWRVGLLAPDLMLDFSPGRCASEVRRSPSRCCCTQLWNMRSEAVQRPVGSLERLLSKKSLHASERTRSLGKSTSILKILACRCGSSFVPKAGKPYSISYAITATAHVSTFSS
mmetsp:Transcript_10512/g.26939  ORF Transcript_10512/g.26939 Transcript_10512/m.26939 type:complete len:251 (-) Transcript_10512:1448-2200(-)